VTSQDQAASPNQATYPAPQKHISSQAVRPESGTRRLAKTPDLTTLQVFLALSLTVLLELPQLLTETQSLHTLSGITKTTVQKNKIPPKQAITVMRRAHGNHAGYSERNVSWKLSVVIVLLMW